MKIHILLIMTFMTLSITPNELIGQDKKPPKTISLRSSGELEIIPDEASFSINLECLESTAKAAKGLPG